MKTKHLVVKFLVAISVMLQLFTPTEVFAGKAFSEIAPAVVCEDNLIISTAESDPTITSPIPIDLDFSSKTFDGLSIDEIEVTNGVASDIVQNAGFQVTPTAYGLVTVVIPAGAVRHVPLLDACDVYTNYAASFQINYGTEPSASLSTPSNPTSAYPVPYTATFS